MRNKLVLAVKGYAWNRAPRVVRAARPRVWRIRALLDEVL